MDSACDRQGEHARNLSCGSGGRRSHTAAGCHSPLSISKDGGQASYRGLIHVNPGATGSRSRVVCDALILDDESRTDTYPYIDIK